MWLLCVALLVIWSFTIIISSFEASLVFQAQRCQLMCVPTAFLLCLSEVSSVCSCSFVLWSSDLHSAYLYRCVSFRVFSGRPRRDSEMQYDAVLTMAVYLTPLVNYRSSAPWAPPPGTLVWNNQSGAPLSWLELHPNLRLVCLWTESLKVELINWCWSGHCSPVFLPVQLRKSFRWKFDGN